MEKKVPERNVSMKDDDVFYVYEKRINKCVKEGCEGVVKYGLIMKVDTGHEETINCFECNKCHMKYTPYPNYNRLANKQLAQIYNAREVREWQEHTKKKEELRKNAAAKLAGARFGNKRFRTDAGGAEQRSDSGRRFAGSDSRKNYGQGREEDRPYKKSYENKPSDGKKNDREYKKPFDKKDKQYKPKTYTVRKGNIIITRAVDSDSAKRNSGMQMKKRPAGPTGPRQNPNT